MSWHVASTSVIGTSHQTQGVPCQDEHTTSHQKNALILVASDGAGSATHSKTGALIATTAATAYLTSASTRQPTQASLARALRRAVLTARNAITTYAQQQHHPTAEYATTLLVAVITKRHLGIASVGDGAIVTNTMSGQLTVHTKPQPREYLNDTTFLTCDNYQEALHITATDATTLHGIALLTDGIEALCINRSNNTAHDRFFHPLFHQYPTSNDLNELLNSTNVCDRTTDDKTLVLAIRSNHDAAL